MSMAESHNTNADHFERADVVLQVADLRAGYGRVPVLHGVNLQIHEAQRPPVLLRTSARKWA